MIIKYVVYKYPNYMDSVYNIKKDGRDKCCTFRNDALKP